MEGLSILKTELAKQQILDFFKFKTASSEYVQTSLSFIIELITLWEKEKMLVTTIFSLF